MERTVAQRDLRNDSGEGERASVRWTAVAEPGRISIVTLGVADVARSAAFYEALGWRRSAASQDEVAFFSGPGSRLAIYGRAALAEDAGVADDDGPPGAFSGVALAVNLADRHAVDGFLAAAEAVGARVTKPAADASWGGYSGYFADPDGHAWEVAWNPHFPLGGDGLPTLP